MIFICITTTDGSSFAGEVAHPNPRAFGDSLDSEKRIKLVNPAVIMLGRAPVVGPNGEYYSAVDEKAIDVETASRVGAENLKLKFVPKITAFGRSEMWFRSNDIKDFAQLSPAEEKSYRKAVREIASDNSSLVVGIPTTKAGK